MSIARHPPLSRRSSRQMRGLMGAPTRASTPANGAPQFSHSSSRSTPGPMDAVNPVSARIASVPQPWIPACAGMTGRGGHGLMSPTTRLGCGPTSPSSPLRRGSRLANPLDPSRRLLPWNRACAGVTGRGGCIPMSPKPSWVNGKAGMTARAGCEPISPSSPRRRGSILATVPALSLVMRVSIPAFAQMAIERRGRA